VLFFVSIFNLSNSWAELWKRRTNLFQHQTAKLPGCCGRSYSSVHALQRVPHCETRNAATQLQETTRTLHAVLLLQALHCEVEVELGDDSITFVAKLLRRQREREPAAAAVVMEERSAVASLLENDPGREEFIIELQHENDPAALARALRQNDYIKCIWFCLEGVAENANFDIFLQEVAQHGSLEIVKLIDAENDDERLPPINSRPFLEAFQRNERITNVQLNRLRLFGNDVAAMLDNSSSISTIEMRRCEAHAAVAIAAALERSTTIESLELDLLSTPFVVRILQGLQHNKSVKKVTYSRWRNIEESLALGALLTSTTTIEKLHLYCHDFSAETFQPICQGLVQSQSVTALQLSFCDLRGQGFNPLFQALFRTKLNLYSLQIEL